MKRATVKEAEDFEPEEPVIKAGAVTATDRWEGQDEEEEVKAKNVWRFCFTRLLFILWCIHTLQELFGSQEDNWGDEEDQENKAAEAQKTEPKVSEKKKLNEKIKEKEKNQLKKREEIKKRLEEPEPVELSPEEQLAEKLRLKKLQEDSDLELAKEAFGSPKELQTPDVRMLRQV
ncbi:eukaryotic translation initiation factor 3 subunit J-like isoform X2 [Hyperolius riggenbachi]|uniref:eukaryotic translation initiation factor 3 subunit J-like isoform X2 n=1 Tax=Hyperolius riggenbachi TaxID=752182 RepID=UPI0035A2D0D6